jgi:hypothetical protein
MEAGTVYESVQCSCGATVSFGATDSSSVGLALILFDTDMVYTNFDPVLRHTVDQNPVVDWL